MANFNQSPLGQTTISANLSTSITPTGVDSDLATIGGNSYVFNIDGSGTTTVLYSATVIPRPTSGQTWPRYIFSG